MSARALAVGLLCLAATGHGLAAEPKDVIKSRRWEIQQVPFREDKDHDPYKPMSPLREGLRRTPGVVRIASLQLSSVINGKRKVAIFKLEHPNFLQTLDFSYILVNGLLIGPDHNPVPGIVGSIEPGERKGSYRVILKQAGEVVRFMLPSWQAWDPRLTEKTVPKSKPKSEDSAKGGNE